MPFTLVDAVLLLLVLIGAWAGRRRGFLAGTFDLLTVLASLAVAFVFHNVPVDWAWGKWPPLDPWLAPLSFVVLFVVAFSLIGAVTWRLVRAIPPRVHGNGLNRALGLVPGTVNGVIHATLALLLVLTIPLFGRFADYARSGIVGARLAQPATWLAGALEPIFEPAVRKVEKALTVPAQSRRTIALDFREPTAEPRPDLEARMLELVNAERRQRQLKPLRADPELVEVARAHSQDMLRRGYFSHVSPEGDALPERMKREEVRYLVAGENLALAPDVKIAHEGLMDSPGHRANILRPQFGQVGIGVLDAGEHGLMVTQNYSN